MSYFLKAYKFRFINRGTVMEVVSENNTDTPIGDGHGEKSARWDDDGNRGVSDERSARTRYG